MKISFSRGTNFFINSFLIKSFDTVRTILMLNCLNFDGTKLSIYSNNSNSSYYIFSFHIGYMKKLFEEVENTFQERTKNFKSRPPNNMMGYATLMSHWSH